MKRIMILILCFICLVADTKTTQKNIQTLLKEEHDLEGDQFCNYVYRRYYFVKRLHNTMLMFLDVEERIKKNGYRPVQLDGLFDFNEDITFKDLRIQRSVDVMQQKRSLKPLFMIWEDFTGYKSIKDQVFVEEFTKEVFIISRNMLITLAAYDEFVVLPPVRINPTPEQLLDDIDQIRRMIYSAKDYEGVSLGAQNERTQDAREVDLHTFAHIDDVMMRYYVIKRLKIACSQLNDHVYRQTLSVKSENSCSWHHPLIISCKNVMKQSQSLDPLIDLWHEVLQYKYVQDDLFMHEFAQLLLCTYADLAACYHQEKGLSHKDALTTALELYQLIDKLPLSEILDVIDIITHDLPPLLAKYEFDSDIPWQAWLRKYWWAPPLIVATIVVHVLMTWETKYLLNQRPEPKVPPVAVPGAPTKQIVTSRHEGDYSWMLDGNGFFFPSNS